MRITGGALVGRRVALPPGVIRPAMDRMRESIFSVLGDISGKSFLDLFSGSGIIALEAASRGAAYIEAVEQDKQKSRTLIQNTQIARPQHIFCRFIACELYILRAKRRFDIIFCDPPFPYAFKSSLLDAIAASPLMHPRPPIQMAESPPPPSIVAGSPFPHETRAGSPPPPNTADNAAEEAPSLLLLHRPREETIDYPAALRLTDRREYGRSIVDFLA